MPAIGVLHVVLFGEGQMVTTGSVMSRIFMGLLPEITAVGDIAAIAPGRNTVGGAVSGSQSQSTNTFHA